MAAYAVRLKNYLSRAMLLREPASAYVVERIAKPLINRGSIKRISRAPVFGRPAYAIYPAKPTHPDVQTMALEGLRKISQKNLLHTHIDCL